MRIAWIVYGSIGQTSGGYIYDRKVIEGLRDQGDRVDVISLEPGSARDSIILEGYEVVVADELCFAEVGPIFRGLPGGPLRVLLVHHLSAWESSEPAVLVLERDALAAADVCIATSGFTRGRLLAEGLASEVSVAEPGADRLPLVARRETQGLRLLFIGNLIPRKRVLELLTAFGELDAPDAELVLIGDPERDSNYAAQLKSLVAHSSALNGRVRITGLLDDHELADELAGASALVLPSALEGYGIVLGEALHAGVPLIAARVGAAEDLIARTQAGLSFLPGDARALAGVLGEFVSKAALRAKLEARASSAAATLPTWRETVSRFRSTLLSAR